MLSLLTSSNMNNYLFFLEQVGEYVILIPALLGTCLSLTGRQAKLRVVELWGPRLQALIGGIGVIIHELSHLIVALIFGHHINHVTLLHIPNPRDPSDTGLGVVNHAWNTHNWYQKMGNFFIGIAPLLGCTLVLWVITNWLCPFLLVDLALPTYGSAPVSWWRLLLWLFLTFNISVGGFDLSGADFHNSLMGVGTLIIVILFITLALAITMNPQSFHTQLIATMKTVYLIMAFSLACNLGWIGLLTIVKHCR